MWDTSKYETVTCSVSVADIVCQRIVFIEYVNYAYITIQHNAAIFWKPMLCYDIFSIIFNQFYDFSKNILTSGTIFSSIPTSIMRFVSHNFVGHTIA